jgi:hypothetical protein
MEKLQRSLGLFFALSLLLMAPMSLAAANLRITSPPSGTVVSPGETISVTVSADPEVQQISLAPEPPLHEAQPGPSPSTFTLVIPAGLAPGSHDLRALGLAGGELVTSDYVTLNVERFENPLRLRTEPAILQLRNRGDHFPLRVIGTYRDGSQTVLTASHFTAYSSMDPTIATVNSSGIVTAVAPGKTSIVVTTSNLSYSLQVGVLAAAPTSLFLGNGRFRVDVRWTTSSGAGDGMPVPLTADTGYFWFFNSSNIEMVVKVLDACAVNQYFWVYAGGLTDQGVTFTVTDTQKGISKTYSNTLGQKWVTITDSSALASCP